MGINFMGPYKYIIGIICVAILFSGCVGEQNVTPTPIPTQTSQVTATVTPTATVAPLIPEITPTGNKILISLDNRRGFIPVTMTINAGDEIVWRNTDTDTVTLISKENLFEVQMLSYDRQYSYIFKKTGTYSFYLENNTALNGTIIVESRAAVQTSPTPVKTTDVLPADVLYVEARMETPTSWGFENYSLDSLKVQIFNQRNTPLSIKAQIVNEGKVLEERSFTLEKVSSSYQFVNEKQHFIKNTNVTLRLMVQGYVPIEYPFNIVERLN